MYLRCPKGFKDIKRPNGLYSLVQAKNVMNFNS